MKKIQKPTREQRKVIESYGYVADNWYVVKNTVTELEIISKSALAKGLKTTKTLQKTG